MPLYNDWNTLTFSNFQYVSKDVLEAADFILANNFISVDLSENEIAEYKKDSRNSNIKFVYKFAKFLCTKNNSAFFDNLKQHLENNQKTLTSFKSYFSKIDLNTYVCSGKTCNYKSCPFIISIYKIYCEQTGKTGKELLKREAFQKQEIINDIQSLITDGKNKKMLLELLKYVKFYEKNKSNDISLPKIHFNFALMGNTGTGKTKVTELIKRIFDHANFLKNNNVVSLNLDSILKADQLIGYFEQAKDGLLIIDHADTVLQYHSIDKLTQNRYNEIISFFPKCLVSYANTVTVILCGSEININNLLHSSFEIKNMFNYKMIFNDFTDSEMTNLFFTELENWGYTIDENEKDSLVQHILENRNKSDYKNSQYINHFFNGIVFEEALHTRGKSKKLIKMKLISNILNNASNPLTSVNKLDNMIGMDNIKNQINKFTAYLKFNNKIRPLGNNQLPLNLHMAFLGNPGTGKTTVARTLAQTLYQLGYCKEPKLTEVGRSDLIAAYTGQTAIKTLDILQKAKGGVLFIDEAYSITAQMSSESYGGECIATLLKYMEDYKEHIVIIFAGYKDEMESFLTSNPGLKSRIGYILNFNDYTTEELYSIFRMKISNYGFSIDEDASEKIITKIKTAQKSTHFGNGRYIDNFLQEILLKHSLSTENSIIEKELLTISARDIPDDYYDIGKKTTSIGFTGYK